LALLLKSCAAQIPTKAQERQSILACAWATIIVGLSASYKRETHSPERAWAASAAFDDADRRNFAPAR
jgi:hypothetical protein